MSNVGTVICFAEERTAGHLDGAATHITYCNGGKCTVIADVDKHGIIHWRRVITLKMFEDIYQDQSDMGRYQAWKENGSQSSQPWTYYVHRAQAGSRPDSIGFERGE